MHVEFRLYASLRDAVGERSVVRDLEVGTTIAAALRNVAEEYESLESLLLRSDGQLRRHVTVALNGEPLTEDRGTVPLSDGDVLTLSPGVSGGGRV